METIKIDVGVDTFVDIKLEKYDFAGIHKIIFTIKNSAEVDEPVIVEREFTEPKNYTVKITAAESLEIQRGALYDFNAILNDEEASRIKISDNGSIELIKGVGDAFD